MLETSEIQSFGISAAYGSGEKGAKLRAALSAPEGFWSRQDAIGRGMGNAVRGAYLKMTIKRFFLAFLAAACLFAMPGCGRGTSGPENSENNPFMEESKVDFAANAEVLSLPQELLQIPEEYFEPASRQGELLELYYKTWESMTYDQKSQRLTKRAMVYLPYGYSEERQYPVFYLMHGGWSDETTYLGTKESPHELKNILDHAMVDGVIQPMIVVCPTYNNLSSEDSADYGLALELTENYHNELLNDLIPAVEGMYSTYAEDTSPEGIAASRDYRAFAGFSMGSVATWRTFQYCLDAFRYFMPSSGSMTTDGDAMAAMVKDSGHNWDDFFIFAATGTEDFAYSSFKRQIEAMVQVGNGTFRFADNEQAGNLYYLEQEGGTHTGAYALQYFYNGLCWLWQG